MPILSKQELNGLVGDAYKSVEFSKSATASKSLERIDGTRRYDIFLSHSSLDMETIQQLNYLLEEILHFSVFVDWIEHPELDRSKVSPTTAAIIRSAMDRSDSLLYAVSANSAGSKWMPWELGYSDAKHGKIAILPISTYRTTSENFGGQEYLGLYPYVTIDSDMAETGRYLWIHDPENWYKYHKFGMWKAGWELIDHGKS